MKSNQQFPTLFDRVRASTFIENQLSAFLKPAELRRKIQDARRFTLDDKMSSMLADLATQAFAFIDKDGKRQNHSLPVQLRAIEAMRTGARLPHKVTWIEYDLRETHKRLRRYAINGRDIYNEPLTEDLSQIPAREGWLLEQHPQVDTAFRATLYTWNDSKDEDGFDCWQFPWAFVWNTTDDPLPWKTQHIDVVRPDGSPAKSTISDVVVGLFGYHTDHVGVQVCDYIRDSNRETQRQANDLLKEWTGVMRRMWALLATINDLPVEFKEVKAARGFMAKRNYHRFLDHKTITLTIPASEYVKVARAAVAQARRRGHDVRGHWRKDWRNPPSILCEHVWTPTEHYNECSICKGRKLWIRDHQRGDASLGFVVHDYRVEQKEAS